MVTTHTDATDDPADPEPELLADAARSQAEIDTFVLACHGNRAAVEAALAEHPTLINTRSTQDETPLGAAAHVGNRGLAEYLLAHGAAPELTASAMLGQADVVLAAVDADPALANARGAHGISILFHAAVGGHEQLAPDLVARGAQTSPELAGSILHAAVHTRQVSLASWALGLGADVQAHDYAGQTPLQRAQARVQADADSELIALLQARGAGR